MLFYNRQSVFARRRHASADCRHASTQAPPRLFAEEFNYFMPMDGSSTPAERRSNLISAFCLLIID